LEVYEICGRALGFRFQKVREAFFEFTMFDQLSEGHRDSDLLNLVLKIKGRCKLWNFSYFRNMVDLGGYRGPPTFSKWLKIVF
jgi:hypothetical protein